MISVVIPTLNRPVELLNAVKSILKQTILPNELIIIDQSKGKESYLYISELFFKENKFNVINLLYYHEPDIKSLVAAKNFAITKVTNDFILFFDDDIILENDYIQQIINGFKSKPNMLGCSGIITNPNNNSFMYKLFFNLFHIGIYKDLRVNIYGCYNGRNNCLIESDKISGGLSAWRREVFSLLKYDEFNSLHMYEDIDFSTRAVRYFGNNFYINPNARLEHHHPIVNRDDKGLIQKRKVIESILFFNKINKFKSSYIALYWLLFGMFIDSIFQTFKYLKINIILGFFSGLVKILKKSLNNEFN